ncbi:hypothetical protein WMF18_05270 [Sorangium sp. So ce315]|uniref:hypothetical protein n=1 Tax=Sorangium sp. So ce315 TaxID=3133299 RepID=UPI003F645D9F
MMLSPRFFSMAAGSLALLVQAACGGAVIVDGGGGGADGADVASGPDATTTAVGPTTSVGPAPTTSGGSAGAGPSALIVGESTVTLRIASIALSCRDPDARPRSTPCSDWWDLELVMPEWMLAVGEVNLASSDVSLFGSAFNADCGTAAGATGGGAAAGFGRLTITAVDETSVTFELSEVGRLLPGHDPNGRYVAPRCAE